MYLILIIRGKNEEVTEVSVTSFSESIDAENFVESVNIHAPSGEEYGGDWVHARIVDPFEDVELYNPYSLEK